MYPHSEAQDETARPSRSCLWGCAGLLVAVVLLLAGTFGYGAWKFYHFFHNDSRIQLVLEAARANSQALEVLGKNIQLEGLETYTYDESTGRGGTATYVLNVAGSRGSGKLKADLIIKGGDTKITLLVLSDSDGRSYYLIGTPPPNPMLQDSI